jgi:Protein of unknown function (DUF2630)
MNDADVLMAVRRLVDREHPPRARNERSDTDPAGEHGELSAVEEQLDQRWDLLGERPARHRRRAGPGRCDSTLGPAGGALPAMHAARCPAGTGATASGPCGGPA